MIADQNFYDICFMFFYPTALATAYDQWPKFVRVEHSAEGENMVQYWKNWKRFGSEEVEKFFAMTTTMT